METESIIFSRICPPHHHQNPPGGTPLNFQRRVSGCRLPPPWIPGSSQCCFGQQTVIPGEPVRLQTHSLVQSCLRGESTAEPGSRPDRAAPPLPGLLGEVMPSPAALEGKKPEAASTQAQRGKHLGGGGQLVGHILSEVWDRNGLRRSHISLKGTRRESALKASL